MASWNDDDDDDDDGVAPGLVLETKYWVLLQTSSTRSTTVLSQS
jgi:hypothetical protein